MSSSSSLNTVDIEEVQAEHRAELHQQVNDLPQLLGKLHGDSAYSWNSRFNDPLVRTHFKVQRQQVSVEELLMDFYFLKSKEHFEKWRNSSLVDTLLSLFRTALPAEDLHTRHELAYVLQKDGKQLGKMVLLCLKNWANNYHLPQTSGPYKLGALEVISHNLFVANVVPWMTLLSRLLMKGVTETTETDYVDLFAALMRCFSLVVRDGRNEGLSLGNSSCDPDLLFTSLNPDERRLQRIWFPFEAKSWKWDPELEQAFKKKAKKSQVDNENKSQGDPASRPSNEPHEDVIKDSESKDDLIQSAVESSASPRSASGSDDLSTSPVTLPVISPVTSQVTSPVTSSVTSSVTLPVPPASKIAGTSRKMSSGDDNHDIPRKRKRVHFSSWSGSALHPSTRETVKAFFSQLLGSVIALQQENPSEKQIGIGVVGYKIVFLAYHGCDHEEKPIYLGEVPKKPGAKTLVQLTKPLCILNAQDREEIALALLALGTSPAPGEC